MTPGPVAHETDAGWVSLIALADGVVLTHVLTVDECRAGMVSGDYDLALWTRLAGDSLPLADGGGVVARLPRPVVACFATP